MADMLCKFIAQVVTAYHADDDRVYLTGFSYGASSTWRVALMATHALRRHHLLRRSGNTRSDP